jgi:hypothetical protein
MGLGVRQNVFGIPVLSLIYPVTVTKNLTFLNLSYLIKWKLMMFYIKIKPLTECLAHSGCQTSVNFFPPLYLTCHDNVRNISGGIFEIFKFKISKI